MSFQGETEFAFGRYRIRADERVLHVDRRRVALAPKVADTLLALLESRDRVVSKAELMERIWPDTFVDESNLTQNVYVLRKTFARYGGATIENVPKRGYRLVVEAAPPAAAVAVKPAVPLRLHRFGPALLAAALLLGLDGSTATPRGTVVTAAATLSASALQHDALGRYYLNRGTERDLHRSLAAFDALVRERPESALGYAGLSDVYTSLTFRTTDPASRVRIGARAIAYANQALARDAGSADAYAALGAAQASVEHDDRAAVRSFETALRLQPRDLDALVWYGTERMNGGDVAAARRLFERAVAVDPTSPGPIASLAWADFLQRRFGDAAAFSEQLLRAHQLPSIARITLASSYVEMGDYARALPHVRLLCRERETLTQGCALLAQVYALRGETGLARAALANLESRTDPGRVGPWDVLALAAANARLGRDDAAFVWLARVRSAERRQLARDPRFDRLRKDPRFGDWVGG